MDIKSVIARHGFKQTEVAEQLGITKGALNQSVHGENTSIKMLRKIANVIGCSVSEFFEDEAPKKDEPSLVCPVCGTRLRLVAD